MSSSPIGAFPQTPVAGRKLASMAAPRPDLPPPNNNNNNNNNPLPVAPAPTPQGRGPNTNDGTGPLIPLRIFDAPTQRAYAVGVYMLFLAWKLYDWMGLVEEDTESFWLFLKWIAIDCVLLFGLPELRIPWLELSQPFVVAAFFMHAIFDWMLMFNVGVCTAGLLQHTSTPTAADY